MIHEQNAVLGRVNRMMAPRVDAVAVAYRNIQRFPAGHEAKLHITGNPVRDEIVAIRDDGFPPLPEDGIFRLLVVGGSLGATVLSDVVPAAIAMLPRALLDRLQVVQQCREADLNGARQICRARRCRRMRAVHRRFSRTPPLGASGDRARGRLDRRRTRLRRAARDLRPLSARDG